MADDDNKGSSLPIPQIIAVLAAIIAVIIPQKPPLASSRPSSGDSVKPETEAEERVFISARLWQDPFQVVEAFRRELTPGDKRTESTGVIGRLHSWLPPDKHDEGSAARLRALRSYISSAGDHKTLVLIGCLPAVTNAENMERRLRERWAVLAALGRSGYVPRERIGYFLLDYSSKRNGRPPAVKEQEQEPEEMTTRVPIPYELIEPQFGNAQSCSDPTLEHVLLLWLPDDWVGTKAIDLLGQLGVALEWRKRSAAVRVLGPSTSTVLTQFAQDATDLTKGGRTRMVLKMFEHTMPGWFRRSTAFKSLERFLIDVAGFARCHKDQMLAERMNIQPWGHPIWPAVLNQMLTVSEGIVDKIDAVMIRKCEFRNYYGGAFENMEMISASATIADVLLHAFADRDETHRESFGLQEALHDMGIVFNRSIATDDVVAYEIINELKLRGVRIYRSTSDPKVNYVGSKKDLEDTSSPGPDDVAVIAEWDTPYGRCLPLTLRLAAMDLNRHPEQIGIIKRIPDYPEDRETRANLVALVRRGPWRALEGLEKEVEQDLPLNIHQFYYYKGIDGQVNSTDAAKDKGKSESTQAGEVTPSKAPAERAAGENQADYLRRLAGQLASVDYDLRRRGRHIRAVLVLGSDLYDKFMVIKAIRPVLSNALYVTNNLDADMAALDELGSTQNLIIVSPFGLTLGDFYQRGVPAFRDSYQTSLYVSTLAATRCLDKSLYGSDFSKGPMRWKGLPEGNKVLAPQQRPRVFETGRSGFYDMSRDFGSNDDLPFRENLTAGKTRLHPLRSGADGWLGRLSQDENKKTAWLVSWAGFGFGLVLLLFCLMGENASLLDVLHSRLAVVCMGLFVAFVVPVALFWAQAWSGEAGIENGEPLSWISGVSVWPTQGLRLAAIVVLLHLIARTMKKYRDTHSKISRQFFPEENGAGAQKWHLWEYVFLGSPILLFGTISTLPGISHHGGMHLLKGIAATLIFWVTFFLRPKAPAAERVHMPAEVMAREPAEKSKEDEAKPAGFKKWWAAGVSLVKMMYGAISRLNKPLWGGAAFLVLTFVVLGSVFTDDPFTPPIFSGAVILASLLGYGVFHQKMADDLHCDEERVVQPGEVWHTYLHLGCWQCRVPRVLLLTNALLWLAALLLECWSVPQSPGRGWFAVSMDKFTFAVCMMALSGISAGVVDAVLLNRIFTRVLWQHRSQWQEGAGGNIFRSALGDGINEYLDMRLLAARSKPIANFIYSPFIVLGIMVLAQHRVLDYFPLYTPVVMIWVVNLALACFCAWLLQRESNLARNQAIRKLEEERAIVAGILGAARREERLGIFDKVIGEIRDLREGAFAPLWDQPFVRAIFFSSGSIGLSSIISALSGWWK